jgi:hypothetical protein
MSDLVTRQFVKSLAVLVLSVCSLLVSAYAQQPGAEQDTDRTYVVQMGDSLELIAARFYGNRSAGSAILLATNAAAGTLNGVEFIQNPEALKPGQKLLIPPADEAMQLTAEYDAYSGAVLYAASPHERDRSKALLTIPADAKSLVVVTWTRSKKFQVDQRTASSDIWVTVAPNLKMFCSAVQDRRNLTLRLEQRLGLPPHNGKSEFVEIQISDPDNSLFRPCPDFSIHHDGCTVGFAPKGYPPDVDQLSPRQIWFLSQYYQSYALARPQQYPWTALGYTFDWGSEDHVGESEFVVPKGSPIRVRSITRTEDYCRQ